MMTKLTLSKIMIWKKSWKRPLGKWMLPWNIFFLLQKLPFSKIMLWKSTMKYKICIIKITIWWDQLSAHSLCVPWVSTSLLQLYSELWVSTELTFIRFNYIIPRYLANQNFSTAQYETFVSTLASLRSISQVCLPLDNKGLRCFPYEKHFFQGGSLT